MSNDVGSPECKVTCRYFRCSKRALKIVRKNGKKTFICTMDNDECMGYACNYAECAIRKLADDGRCLKPSEKKTVPVKVKRPRDRYAKYDYMTANDLDDRLVKKLNRKLR
ncbi:MAG: hypothetical protein ACTSYD_06415 [Candidatus Heimdallarchaeaceae archaeon]